MKIFKLSWQKYIFETLLSNETHPASPKFTMERTDGAARHYSPAEKKERMKAFNKFRREMGKRRETFNQFGREKEKRMDRGRETVTILLQKMEFEIKLRPALP